MKKLILSGTVAATLCCSVAVSAAAESLGVKVERNVPVRMRDGIVLRADVHRPDRGGPYPVLVRRTPYGKDGSFNKFVKAGYIVVSQDARGTGKSDGRFELMWLFKTHDAEDGYDTVEWAARLPGSTGRVGTFGTSYDAFLQWRLAPLRPPSLAAMSACSIPAQIWYIENPCTIRPGFRLEWGAMMALDMRRRQNLPGVHAFWEHRILWKEEEQKWLNWLPWLDLPEDFFGYETEVIKSWLKNPHVDPWKLHEGCRDVSVPNLDIVGWYDHANGDMLLFRTMVKEAKTQAARAASRIIVGPWGHGSWHFRRVGNIDFGSSSTLDQIPLQIRWFDYWLKGTANGVDKDAPVRIFVMGDNQWRSERHWPLQNTKDRILYVTSRGHANTPSGDGKLVPEKPQSVRTDSYVYDPNNPIPTPFGPRRPVPADQRSLAAREDILVYQTAPLTERVEVTGNPVVELFAASSAPDTDWFVRLIDVAPNGLARDVSSGVVRARYRNGFDKPRFIKPGEVIKYTIRMSATSNAFLPGHRIRLDITSSDFPNYDRNHNTAAEQNGDAALVAAKQIISHGGKKATRIVLPWVPDAGVQTSRQEGPDEFNESLLDASSRGDAGEVKSAISKGADINIKDDSGTTALHIAARKGYREIVELLLASGADVNSRGPYNTTPAELAWHKYEDVFKLLVAKGADISPLHLAVDTGKLSTVKGLIQEGADLNRRTPYGTTPLDIAARKGLKDIAELLIDNGAHVDAKDNWDWTPLHSAAERGQMDVVKVLVAKGAPVDARDGDLFTPLHYALWEGHKDVARCLVEKGAEVDTNMGESTALHSAVHLKEEERVRNILAATVIDINVKESDSGLTPLHLAAAQGVRGIAELLLAKGAKVDQKDDEYAFTPLHYAARFGHKDIAELLIAKRANIHVKDKWGFEPIHIAAFHDRKDLVELLIAKGADVNVKTSLGQTPLKLAESRRNQATIELLHRHGATWNDGLLLDERSSVSYPDGLQDKDGLIWITYDRDRNGAGEILLAKFREEDVAAGRSVFGAASLRQIINKLDKPALLPAGWDPKKAGEEVMRRLIRVSAPKVKGAHDAGFACVGDRTYVVEMDNDIQPGHGAGSAQYCVLSVVNLKSLAVEKVVPLAKSEQVFDNVTLPKGMCFVPRIIQKDAHTLRAYFCSQPAGEQAVTWYRDFDLQTQSFEGAIHKAKLKTAAGTFDMEPRHFHADAVAHGFGKPAMTMGLYIIDSFKEFDGRRYVAINNFPGKQNALARLHDDFETFEIIGHYNEPQSEQLSESSVNRLPDGTWMAICRNDSGNYHFTTSQDGRAWSIGREMPFVKNGLNSKPTFDRFGAIYYLGWQENTRIQDCNRSVFNVDVSNDGQTWERKYRFETPHSFQYPTFHEHGGVIWLTVTQSDHKGTSDRIMFGKLEDLKQPGIKEATP
jgi:putative CocE/NonD family hydrolase